MALRGRGWPWGVMGGLGGHKWPQGVIGGTGMLQVSSGDAHCLRELRVAPGVASSLGGPGSTREVRGDLGKSQVTLGGRRWPQGIDSGLEGSGVTLW